MIEYDKANVTSSYPSLTKYEVATILDKAYLALIARKLTGNNTRRVPFEYDVKAIEDLRPLITSKIVNTSTATTTASNELAFKLPDDLLYYLEGQASYTNDNSETADNKDHFNEIVNLVDHRTAQRFRATNTNMPWIKQPVSFLQGGDVYVLYDTYKHHDPLSLLVTYLEKPASFVASLVGTEDEPGGNPGGNEPGGDEPGGGGGSGSETNKYIIRYTSKPLTVYNITQMGSYSATASNNTTTSEVSFSVVSGSEYAYIQQGATGSYILIVKPAATSTKTVRLRATCVNDTSVYEEFDVNVTYYMQTPTGTIQIGSMGVTQTGTSITLYVSTNVNRFPCYMCAMVKHPDNDSSYYAKYRDWTTLSGNIINRPITIDKTQEDGRIQVYLCSSQDTNSKFAELSTSVYMSARVSDTNNQNSPQALDLEDMINKNNSTLGSFVLNESSLM